ncbi:MAG: hypothetical protein QXG08_01025 [Candidatus Methanomethyliaceae archaeon]
MPKCPKCGAEISELRVVAHNPGRLALVDGTPVYEWASDVYGDSVVGMEYICPECGETLFSEPTEAENFLTG